MRPQNPNIELTRAIARRLGPLLPDLTFVGGCATGLLITDPASAPARPTRDVDVIAEVTSYADYSVLSERLRVLGFMEDSTEDAPLCRWQVEEMKLDVMPTSAAILGFSNRWYEGAIRSASQNQLDTDLVIRLVSGPYFLGTKMEAFRTRGHNDFRISSDLEDMIAVVDGRIELLEETRAESLELRRYLGSAFRAILASQDFLDALPGHLLPDTASQQRAAVILERMAALAEL